VADVAARLAQGLPAVDNASTYAGACRQLGYHGVSDAALRDWYGTEDGMDLAVLQSDCDAVARAASAVQDAATRQAELATRLAGAWSGTGASAAQQYLADQNDAATAVSDGLVTATAALATLRDDLWQAVDAKVNAALDIDGRPSGQRGEWLAAAHTVTTGAGDVATASELVDQQVKPFVDNDIGAELLSEMRAGFDRVTDAFDAAIARLEASPAARFEAPGEVVASGVSPASTMPAAAAPVDPPAPPAGEFGGGMPGLGSGIPSLGGGLSGFGQQLADLIGGFTGSADALPEPEDLTLPDDSLPEVDEPEADESDEEDSTEDEIDDEDGNPDEEEAADMVPSAEDESEVPAEPGPEPMSVPEPVTPPLPQSAALVPEALPEQSTPCEIAAEELPRVGE
jgi:hypothetical protein